jgi:hypothetical protein
MADVGMFDSADIDTGVQRIWSQVSPEDDIPEEGAGQFDTSLDFLGVTKSASKNLERPSPSKSGLSDAHLSAISDGCWILGEMESGVSETERAEAVYKSVLHKESQVAALEAKAERCRRELAELERDLEQARSELSEARAQQGWSGAGAVGMGGAGAVFSTSVSWTPPAKQLSDAFSTISAVSPRASVRGPGMAPQRDLMSERAAQARRGDGQVQGGEQGQD